jgi:hypothetical protein
LSNPVRVDDWYHLLRVDAHYPPREGNWREVRGDLEARLRQRLTEPAMQTLYRALFEQADIRIADPILAREFKRKHPDHGRRTQEGRNGPADGP